MIERNSSNQLQPWLDPDELIVSIGSIRKESIPRVRASLLSLCTHSDPDVREEAVRKLFVEGKDMTGRDQVTAAFQTDPAANVRSTAAYGIAATSDPASRAADARLLLSILFDTMVEGEVRNAVYEALLIMHRKRDFPSLKRGVVKDSDIDWDWAKGLRESFGLG